MARSQEGLRSVGPRGWGRQLLPTELRMLSLSVLDHREASIADEIGGPGCVAPDPGRVSTRKSPGGTPPPAWGTDGGQPSLTPGPAPVGHDGIEG